MGAGAVPRPPGHHLEVVAVDVAREAASLVRGAWAEGRSAIATKATPTDVVTETDLRSEAFIRRELTDRCPGSTIVGEELDDLDGSNAIRWIVDPIDGTVNFLYGLPVVSVSIAATLGGVTVAGAVADVVGGGVFSAALDRGARHDGAPVSASGADEIRQSLIGTGFSYAATRRAEQAAILAEILPSTRDIRCMGSAALNLCWVGAGLLDGYYEHDTKLYDYAAGALIASEGGAIVSSPSGDDHLSIAATPAVFEQLESLVRSR